MVSTQLIFCVNLDHCLQVRVKNKNVWNHRSRRSQRVGSVTHRQSIVSLDLGALHGIANKEPIWKPPARYNYLTTPFCCSQNKKKHEIADSAQKPFPCFPGPRKKTQRKNWDFPSQGKVGVDTHGQEDHQRLKGWESYPRGKVNVGKILQPASGWGLSFISPRSTVNVWFLFIYIIIHFPYESTKCIGTYPSRWAPTHQWNKYRL